VSGVERGRAPDAAATRGEADAVQLTFAAYRVEDAAACLALFDGNVPRYFDRSERDEFARFLAAPTCDYLVGRAPDGAVLACGGWFEEPDEPGVGGLAWGMVDQRWHGRGLGRQLTERRLAALRAMPGVRELVIRTSQHTERFYERAGFHVTRRVPDGHAPGIDFVEMRCTVRHDDAR